MDCHDFAIAESRKDDSSDFALESAESQGDSPPFAFEKILALWTSLRSSSLRLAVVLVEFLVFLHKDSGLYVRALWENAKSTQ